MQQHVVVYTDPKWMLAADGRVNPALATIEREILGHDVELRFGPAESGEYNNSGPVFLATLRGADALVVSRCCITKEILAAAGENLKVVCRQGVGFDNVAPDLLKANGIIGFNIPDYCVDEVATHTLALLLALERGLLAQHQGLSRGRFDPYIGGTPRRLHELTAGIIGFGRIGRVVASRLKMFYKNVLACDPYVSNDLLNTHGVEKVELVSLLERSDAILLHCPLNTETHQMIDKSAFARMKSTAFLINTARGGLIEPRALLDALDGEHIAGAGIDVFSPENPHDDDCCARIVQHSKVVVTSHRAYLSRESEISQRCRAAEGVNRVLKTGLPPMQGLLA